MIDYEPDMSVGMHHLPLFDTSRDPVGKQWPKGLRSLEYPIKLRAGLFDVHEHEVNIDRGLKWIKPFRPDVIFTSPVTYATSRFAFEMSRKLGIPYICHVMDDWLAHWEAGIRPEKPRPGEPRRQARRNKLTRDLWSKASGREVISRLMADEYAKRYGYEFEILHNALDLNQWDMGPRDYDQQGTPFRVIYTGAIWWNIQMPTLKMAADAISELAAAGHNIRLEIYTHPSFEKQYGGQLARPPHVDFYGLVPYEQMPKLMREADALLVPVTFDEKMFVYARCSMPTKIPECMISGTPVVLFGPPEAAPVDYALRDNWGLVISEPDQESFKRQLVELMRNPTLRRQISEPARKLAKERHNLDTVREAFWNRIKAIAT
jgi:glycosyltransferase involved in cell wall biosynthesis